MHAYPGTFLKVISTYLKVTNWRLAMEMFKYCSSFKCILQITIFCFRWEIWVAQEQHLQLREEEMQKKVSKSKLSLWKWVLQCVMFSVNKFIFGKVLLSSTDTLIKVFCVDDGCHLVSQRKHSSRTITSAVFLMDALHVPMGCSQWFHSRAYSQ